MRAAIAVLCAVIVLAISWMCGAYRQSFAIFPRDEAYHAIVPLILSAIPFGLILALLGRAHPIGITVSVTLLIGGVATARVLLDAARRSPRSHVDSGIPRVTPRAYMRAERSLIWKRVFDIGVASVALIVSSPIALVVAIAIIKESGKPIFFRQDRVGRNGKTFSIVKFRTMRTDANSQWARPGDSRITPLGRALRRTSLDELPQLLNVLAGEMSIVGPRPEMQSFAREFERSIPTYAQRYVVQPGITGWAQLYQRRNLEPADMPQVLRSDLFYVEHASLLLDCAIVLKTAAEFLFHRAV
jgi:lipopolysaccharide/colanic/teichoic acid biosynthesis glycosyltransferase